MTKFTSKRSAKRSSKLTLPAKESVKFWSHGPKVRPTPREFQRVVSLLYQTRFVKPRISPLTSQSVAYVLLPLHQDLDWTITIAIQDWKRIGVSFFLGLKLWLEQEAPSWRVIVISGIPENAIAVYPSSIVVNPDSGLSWQQYVMEILKRKRELDELSKLSYGRCFGYE